MSESSGKFMYVFPMGYVQNGMLVGSGVAYIERHLKFIKKRERLAKRTGQSWLLDPAVIRRAWKEHEA